MHRCSRTIWWGWALGGLLLLLPATGVRGQQNAARAQQGAPAQNPVMEDHDPVPSPDPDTPPPAQNKNAGTVGTVTRGAGGMYTLRESAYEVRLNATVLDGGGHTVDSLPKEAFKVYEDNKEQAIVGFRHEDLPVSLGILIDGSGSMYDKRDAVNAAAVRLVQLSNPQDEAFVVDFSFEAFLDQEFTSDIDKLKQGLGYIGSKGGTAMYDALVASADYMSKNAKHPKQVLVVVTDGEDNTSSSTIEEAIRRVQDLDGPVIYCIGLLFGEDVDRSEARHAQRVLESLAEETGGVAFFPKSLQEVNGIVAQVAQDIRTQYTIAYHSTKPPELGGYRQIHVTAKAKGYGKLEVRTRAGYYPHVLQPDAGAGLGGPAQKQTK